MKILRIFLFLFFFTSTSYGSNLSSINVSSLSVLNTTEINNFVSNKIISGFFDDGLKFTETYYQTGDYLFEILEGQDKGFYEGKWKSETNTVCYKMSWEDRFTCVNIYYTPDGNGNYLIYFGDSNAVFSQVTAIQDNINTNTSNNLNQTSQNQQNQTPPPEGTQHIGVEDVISTIRSDYPLSPSDDALSSVNFNMSRDEVVEILKNNNCKILKNWKKRVVTAGQKNTNDLESKCFRKKMIAIGFQNDGTMEFIADVHYIGGDLKTHFRDDFDQNRVKMRIEAFQRYAPEKIYNIGPRTAVCLNSECMEIMWRNYSHGEKEAAFLYFNPKSKIGNAWANKTLDSFKMSIQFPDKKGCKVSQDNPCLIFKAKYIDPSIKYLNRFMNGPRTPERESLRQMYINYVKAEILAAEALGLVDVASDLKLILDYIISDPAQLDMEKVTVVVSKSTNELYSNVNEGLNNEEANKKIEEAHIYASKAGNDGALFFTSIATIFSASNFEDAAAATEVASRTKGNLNYFYKALNKIREAKNINLSPETEKDFGNAEDIVDI
jgi:hypothetical protein